MKKLIIGLSLLFIFTPVANAAKILEYKFNDPSATRAVDTSGNGLNGTFKGDDDNSIQFVLCYRSATCGRDLKLDGVDDYVLVGDKPILDFRNSYTLMSWVKYTVSPERATEPVYKSQAYWINITNATQRPKAGGFFEDCANTDTRWQTVDGPSVIPQNTWTHIASSYNGYKLSLFVNGVLVASKVIGTPVCTNNLPLVVGSAFKHGTPLNFVKGELDDVRLFNNAMTANQVKTSMQ
jgi:hypothetical protein